MLCRIYLKYGTVLKNKHVAWKIMAIRTKNHNLVVATLITASILAGCILANSNQPHTQAQVTGVCPPGSNLAVPTTISGSNVSLSLSITSTTTNVRDVVFLIDGAILGRGVQPDTTPQWQMVWYTQYSTPGAHNISSQIYSTDGTSCTTNAIATNLTNTAVSGVQLNAIATPQTFQGLTNQVINFNLNAQIISTTTSGVDVTQYTYFNNKATSLGSITPLDGSSILKLSTGPVAATGSTSVIASYGGVSKIINIPLDIIAQTATPPAAGPPPTEATSTSTTNTAPTNQPATNTPTAMTDAAIAAASTASIEAEKSLKDCVLAKLGDVRYKAISSGLSRPTAAEFDSMNQCFAARNYVLPSSFVPVAPKEVKNQSESKDIVVGSPSNEIKNGSTALKFKGKAKPNSIVLLYVYSEPLVLSTTADGNGDWSYSLVDPLQPGNHEIYAVVDKGNGTYERSSALDFAIAKAEASAANPKSYSLKLSSIQPTAKTSNKPMLMYVAGIAVLTISMLGVIAFVLYRHGRNKKDPVTGKPTGTVSEPAVQQTSSEINPLPLADIPPTITNKIAHGPSPEEAMVHNSVTTMIEPQEAKTTSQKPGDTSTPHES